MIVSVQLSNLSPQLNFGNHRNHVRRKGASGHSQTGRHGNRNEAQYQAKQNRQALLSTDVGRYTNALVKLLEFNKPPQDLSIENSKRWLRQIADIDAPDVLGRLAIKLPEVIQKRKAA